MLILWHKHLFIEIKNKKLTRYFGYPFKKILAIRKKD